MKKTNMLGSRLALRWAFCAVAMAGLCGPPISQANPVRIGAVANKGGKQFIISVDGFASDTFNGPLVPGGQPAGSDYTITAGRNAGDVVITSIIAGKEPNVNQQIIQGQNVAFIGGTDPGLGEIGYASLWDAGPITDASQGGSTWIAGIEGGYVATYQTQVGDTWQTISGYLVNSLVANGVDALSSGTSLEIISQITDPNTLKGAVIFDTADTGFTPEVQVGTVPEQSSTLFLLCLGALSLLAYDWRRLNEKAYGKRRLPQQ